MNVSTVARRQTAVTALTSNTTILIADGVYDLTNTLNIRGANNVTLRSASGNREAVVLRARGMSNASYGNVPHVIAIYAASDVGADEYASPGPGLALRLFLPLVRR